MQRLRLLDYLEHVVRQAWYRLKRIVGLPTHMDKNFFALDAAVRLQRGILPSGVGMTCAGRSDGAGMQALARISGLAFADAFGATYFDTPFRHIEHCDRAMPDWTAAWEGLFNLGLGERSTLTREADIVDYEDYLNKRASLSPGSPIRVAIHVRRGLCRGACDRVRWPERPH